MAEDLTEYVTGLIFEPTQTDGPGLDVTVSTIYSITEPGRVDFGGGELVSANLRPVETERRNPEDEYGWWNLGAGQYLLEYNERLDGEPEVPLVLQTRDAVRARGAFHPTLFVTNLEPVPLVVGSGGIRLKENARVSTLFDRG